MKVQSLNYISILDIMDSIQDPLQKDYFHRFWDLIFINSDFTFGANAHSLVSKAQFIKEVNDQVENNLIEEEFDIENETYQKVIEILEKLPENCYIDLES